MNREDIQELFEYATRNREESMKNLLQQIVDFLTHKYPGSEIKINEETLTIGETFQKEILNDLKSFNISVTKKLYKHEHI